MVQERHPQGTEGGDELVDDDELDDVDDVDMAEAAPGAPEIEPQVTSKPGETTPDGSQSTWPPDRALPETDAAPEEDHRGRTAPEG